MSTRSRRPYAFARGWRPLLFATFAVIALGVLVPATAAHAEPSIDEIDRQIRSQAAQLEKIIEQYNKVTEELKATQAAAEVLAAELKPLSEELTSATARIGEIAALAYKGAPLAKFSSVLDVGSPSTMVDRLITLDQITKFENGQIASFAETKARHDAEKSKLDGLIAEQTAQRQTLETQKAKITTDIARLRELRSKAYGQQPKVQTAKPATVAAPYVAGKAGAAVSFAYAQVGKPYNWAAAGPGSYDCSGLTMAAWRAGGVSLPHNAAMQWNKVSHISRAALQPGDLVFYSGLNHVGIYVGSNKIIHAPTYGESVQLSSVDLMKPYGYGRPR